MSFQCGALEIKLRRRIGVGYPNEPYKAADYNQVLLLDPKTLGCNGIAQRDGEFIETNASYLC